MPEPTPQQTRQFYEVLKEQLSRVAGGEHVVSAFEQNSAAGEAELAEFLRRHLATEPDLVARLAAALGPDDRASFVTEVTGGHVDQIVNIARLGVLNLTVRRQFFLFRDVKQLAIVLSLVVVVSSVAGYGYWQSKQPRVMTGGFNIAVADFGQETSGGVERSELAETLSGALFRYLESEFSNVDFGLDVQIDHGNMGLVVEKEDAENLANRIKADVIIYGTVTSAGGVAELDPTFWVREKPDTEELTGQNRLGQPIAFAGILPVLSGAEVNKALQTRAAALLSFTKGLVFLDSKEPDRALDEFAGTLQEMNDLGYCRQGAEAASAGEGCEVVHVFLGTAHTILKQYAAAEQEFNTALALNPDYARAYNGLGKVNYDRAIANNFDVGGLDAALGYYEQALAAKDAPASSLSVEKAKYNLGNVYVVRAQQTQDQASFDRAIELYQEVIDAYDKRRGTALEARMRVLAANAYFGLGVAYERQFLIDEAIAAYRQCIELAADDELKQRAQQQIESIEAVG